MMGSSAHAAAGAPDWTLLFAREPEPDLELEDVEPEPRQATPPRRPDKPPTSRALVLALLLVIVAGGAYVAMDPDVMMKILGQEPEPAPAAPPARTAPRPPARASVHGGAVRLGDRRPFPHDQGSGFCRRAKGDADRRSVHAQRADRAERQFDGHAAGTDGARIEHADRPRCRAAERRLDLSRQDGDRRERLDRRDALVRQAVVPFGTRLV